MNTEDRRKEYYVEAPTYLSGEKYDDLSHRPNLFLAGSITGCEDWQARVAPEFYNNGITVFNPRRADFDVTNSEVEQEQIKWEKIHLEFARDVVFYFAKDSVAPITLFELGMYLHNAMAVYVHPEYPRANDVLIQLGLRNKSDLIVRDETHFISKVMGQYGRRENWYY